MSFVQADDVHQVAISAIATRETVPSPVTKQLSVFVRALSNIVKDIDDDDRWNTFLRRCRRTLRDTVTTPIAPDRPTFDIEATAIALDTLLNSLRGSYSSEIVDSAEYCLLAIRELTTESQNPVGDRIRDILATGASLNTRRAFATWID